MKLDNIDKEDLQDLHLLPLQKIQSWKKHKRVWSK